MVYDGYLAIGDPIAAQTIPGAQVVLINNALTAALAQQNGFNVRGCSGCASAQPTLPIDPTTTPWYDPADPASLEFCGFLGLQIGGVSKQPGVRNPLRAGNSGAVLGKVAQTFREIVVHCYQIATSQRGLSYGLAWLEGILRGQCLGNSYDSCSQGMPLTLYTDCNLNDNTQRRQLFNVGLMAGPEQTSKAHPNRGTDCNGNSFWGGDVTFTLAAGKPWMYRDPVPLGANLPFIKPVYWPCTGGWAADPGNATTYLPPNCSTSPQDACVTWQPYNAAACGTNCPGQLTGTCLNDPNCPVPQDAPLPPNPGDPCACLVTLNPVVAMSRMEAGVLPKWSEVVPYVVINAGTGTDTRRILLRFYRSQPNVVCNFNNLNPCDLQGEIGIPYLPQGSTLILDGRAQTAYVTCADGTVSRPLLYSTAGPAPAWPVMSCGQAWCVAITVDVNNVGTGASANVSLVGREGAS